MRDPTRLPGWRCRCGHAFLYAHESCPVCDGPLVPTRLGATARLRTCTTVRVNPTGVPYRIGIAATPEGATTLCVVEGLVRGNGRDEVDLVVRDGCYLARARSWRTVVPVTENSREQDATRARSQKS